jgi:hypothetical protein
MNFLRVKIEIETNKFIDLISDISNHNKGGEDTSEIETNLENKLGEPDSVTYYYEDGLFVEKVHGNKLVAVINN